MSINKITTKNVNPDNNKVQFCLAFDQRNFKTKFNLSEADEKECFKYVLDDRRDVIGEHPTEMLSLISRVDINQSNNKGETLLMLACQKGNTELVHEIFRLFPSCDVDRKDQFNQNALHYAILGNSDDSRIEDLVRMLVMEKNIDINNEGIDKKTPLYKAVEKGRGLALISHLLKKTQNVNTRCEENGGDTPLHVAVNMNLKGIRNEDIIVELIKNGADINSKNNSKLSPLDLAEKKPDLKTLLEEKRNSQQKNDSELMFHILDKNTSYSGDSSTTKPLFNSGNQGLKLSKKNKEQLIDPYNNQPNFQNPNNQFPYQMGFSPNYNQNFTTMPSNLNHNFSQKNLQEKGYMNRNPYNGNNNSHNNKLHQNMSNPNQQQQLHHSLSQSSIPQMNQINQGQINMNNSGVGFQRTPLNQKSGTYGPQTIIEEQTGGGGNNSNFKKHTSSQSSMNFDTMMNSSSNSVINSVSGAQSQLNMGSVMSGGNQIMLTGSHLGHQQIMNNTNMGGGMNHQYSKNFNNNNPKMYHNNQMNSALAVGAGGVAPVNGTGYSNNFVAGFNNHQNKYPMNIMGNNGQPTGGMQNMNSNINMNQQMFMNSDSTIHGNPQRGMMGPNHKQINQGHPVMEQKPGVNYNKMNAFNSSTQFIQQQPNIIQENFVSSNPPGATMNQSNPAIDFLINPIHCIRSSDKVDVKNVKSKEALILQTKINNLGNDVKRNKDKINNFKNERMILEKQLKGIEEDKRKILQMTEEYSNSIKDLSIKNQILEQKLKIQEEGKKKIIKCHQCTDTNSGLSSLFEENDLLSLFRPPEFLDKMNRSRINSKEEATEVVKGNFLPEQEVHILKAWSEPRLPHLEQEKYSKLKSGSSINMLANPTDCDEDKEPSSSKEGSITSSIDYQIDFFETNQLEQDSKGLFEQLQTISKLLNQEHIINQLNEDIVKFTVRLDQYMKDRDTDFKKTIQILEQKVYPFFNSSKIKLYGSYMLNLNIIGSHLDINVDFKNPNEYNFTDLLQYFKQTNLFENCKLTKGKFPKLRVTFKEKTGFFPRKVLFTLNNARNSGDETQDLIKSQMQNFPNLFRPLCLILKQLLRHGSFNKNVFFNRNDPRFRLQGEEYKFNLPSYNLYLILNSYLESKAMDPSFKTEAPNLGKYFVDFLWSFGPNLENNLKKQTFKDIKFVNGNYGLELEIGDHFRNLKSVYFIKSIKPRDLRAFFFQCSLALVENKLCNTCDQVLEQNKKDSKPISSKSSDKNLLLHLFHEMKLFMKVFKKNESLIL